MPIVGWLIEVTNNNYNLVWPATAVTIAFGVAMLFLIKGGEIRKANPPTPPAVSE